MTDTKAPERIWVCKHMGEYGNFYPEAVEAEGEHGGTSVEYVRTDLLTSAEAERDALKAENERLREALRRLTKTPTPSEHNGGFNTGGPTVSDFGFARAILAKMENTDDQD